MTSNPQTTRLREAIEALMADMDGRQAKILEDCAQYRKLLTRYTEAQIEGLISGKNWVAPMEPTAKMALAGAEEGMWHTNEGQETRALEIYEAMRLAAGEQK